MATVPQPYHRVEFSVHVGGKGVPVKLALKPDSTIHDALVQLRNVWAADNSKQSILIPNDLAVMDSEGFWLPTYSPVNCVLKVNDKVSVYKLNKRKKDIAQVRRNVIWVSTPTRAVKVTHTFRTIPPRREKLKMKTK
jgi:hypothetical protein